MKKNMGLIDKIVRIVIAVLIIALYFAGIIGDNLAMALLLISAIFIFTSVLGFCPLYMPLGISTCKKN